MKRNLFSIIGILLMMCVPVTAPADDMTASITALVDKATLKEGEIQTFTKKLKTEDGTMKRVVGVMLIDAPPQEVWKVLLDWEAMGEMVKSLEYYKTMHVIRPVDRADALGNSLIEGQLKVAFLTIRYTLDVLFDHQRHRQDWNLVTDEEVADYNAKGIQVRESKGGIKNIEGFEFIEPYSNGSQSIFYYCPIVEVSVPVPGFIERIISKNSLEEFMVGVREKVRMQNTKDHKE